MKPLLILKTGDTFPELATALGDFDDWVAAGIGGFPGVIERRAVHRDQPLPAATAVGGVIVTGSHAMVSDREPWSERAASWLREAIEAGAAVLGICYGHQLVAHALGGVVGYHPRGREIGTVAIRRRPAGGNDLLLASLPDRFPAQVSHSQSVLELPSGALILAENDHEPHHAVRFSPRVWGLQFHPEFSGAVMAAYIHLQADRLRAEGIDPAIAAAVRETPAAAALLARFAAIVAEG